MNEAPRVAIVVSHPIQHFCPMYGELSRAPWLDSKVFFASKAGLEPYQDANFAREIQWTGMTLDFPHHFLNAGGVAALGPALDAPDLDQALASFDPAVVIVYGYRQALQRRAMAWARRHGRRTLMISDSELRSSRVMWRRLLKKLVVPRIYARIDGFLSVGDANEEHYRHYGVDASRCFRSPFPIDRATFDAAYASKDARRGAIRESLGISRDALVCAMVGKLVPWKRPRDLISAVGRAAARGVDAVALLVGTGPLEGELRDAAASMDPGRVVFAGFVQPRELPDYYSATDIYVHCAELEPHSLAVSEAIYMSRPIILSDACGSHGSSDDVQEGRNGLVYRCADTEQLATLIEQLARDPARREAMGAASREIAVHSQQLANGGGMKAALAALTAP